MASPRGPQEHGTERPIQLRARRESSHEKAETKHFKVQEPHERVSVELEVDVVGLREREKNENRTSYFLASTGTNTLHEALGKYILFHTLCAFAIHRIVHTESKLPWSSIHPTFLLHIAHTVVQCALLSSSSPLRPRRPQPGLHQRSFRVRTLHPPLRQLQQVPKILMPRYILPPSP